MWWLVIPAVGLVGKLVINAMSGTSRTPVPRRSVLEQNLSRLGAELRAAGKHRIAILGQPGAGKSSLLKKMTNGKVCPLPLIGTETDATNWAVKTDCNLLSHFKHHTFVDVPGYDTSSHPANTILANFPFSDVDFFVFVVRGKLRGADEQIFNAIASSGKPVCVARSFAESVNFDERTSISQDLQQRLGLSSDHHIGYFSNRSNEGVKAIFKAVAQGNAPT